MQDRMATALQILTALLVLWTLQPLSRAKGWWVRLLDFPRAQIAVLGIGASIASVWLQEDWLRWSNWTLWVGALVALYQFIWIAPFTRLAAREVKPHRGAEPGRALRILTVNVLQSNRRAARLRRIIRRRAPDLLLALETDEWWIQQLDVFRAELPHVVACPLANYYGMALYSRWPLRDAKVQFLIEPDTPSIHAALDLGEGRIVRLVCLHPAPPSPTENEKSTERDAELILVARSLAREHRPTLVMGDLNDVAWSRTTRLFRKISGLLDPRVGRSRLSTYHAKIPLLRWPVDHLFVSRHFTLRTLRRLPAFGSDHFPVFAELVLNGGTEENQRAPQADARDQREAQEESSRLPPREPVHCPQA
jgi:endonuclease/exonuclease/phosphatase (EEP) superfamily protein YafD